MAKRFNTNFRKRTFHKKWNPKFNSRSSSAPVHPGSLDPAASSLDPQAPSSIAAAAVSPQRFEESDSVDRMDEQMGFLRYHSSQKRKGWLVNVHSTLQRDSEWPGGRSAVDFYFIEDNGSYFKATLTASPYFLLQCRNERESEEFFRKKFEGLIEKIERVEKEDLDMPNHLSGAKRSYLKLLFRNTSDLLAVRKYVLAAVTKNREQHQDQGASTLYEDANVQLSYEIESGSASTKNRELLGMENILDIREYDIPYHLRVCIDHDIRVGLWYDVSSILVPTLNGTGSISSASIVKLENQPVRPDPVVLAFDIETTKLPLKFPDATIDSIMMISYMIDGRGYLLTNREIVGSDIEDFEYTPRPEYEGIFSIRNEKDEKSMLLRFFHHIQTARPTVFVTYNGDSFDWPFVEARASVHGLALKDVIGVYCNAQEEYEASYAIHMDAFKWVKRDSYLPVGSQGLKAVTSIKLGYSPLEIDPEDMLRFAREDPQTLASYSVSDAVCTYYLYMKYVQPFIFSLCNIIPLNPDEVLRKGSGTLCETLLMAQAYHANIVMPNKHVAVEGATFNGHLLESETYVGGHVEALESGVFRKDLPVKFQLDPTTLQTLADEAEATLLFALQVEHGLDRHDVLNYESVKARLVESFKALQARPSFNETPLLYHLDVAAMYPNIMLTNRLQPPSIVTEATCAVCDFNKPGKKCQRRMTWSWRGEYFVAKRNEIKMIRNQLESEKFLPSTTPALNGPAAGRSAGSMGSGSRRGQPTLSYSDLSASEQHTKLRSRLSQYCKKIYKRIHETKVVPRESIVCMRENSFYVDTVRRFRDRRYDFKAMLKDAKRQLDKALEEGNSTRIEETKKTYILYDSLQLAHKCILNSFYGYVMRKGSRWYSMEMAGVVCETGASIITLARKWVEKIGRPLELDTDGIWCMLPSTFPDALSLELKPSAPGGMTKLRLSYPCILLNRLIHQQFTNHQYETLVDPLTRKYEASSENSIFFEIDGPYRAMILPASTEEDRLLKKRYAVFHDDGTLAELKGFEVKRRGELKLTKVFQTQIFDSFLLGSTLIDCYDAVAQVANRWLDILHGQGKGLNEHELFELLSESRSMSKSLEDYGEMKSTSISTAKRLAEFLGDGMVKDKGLACRFVISSQPYGQPVAQRAIPTAIFSAEPPIRDHYLRKWLKDPSLTCFDVRSILDWSYYLERFESVVQKLIVIPAAMQNVPNPVPRVKYPEWLLKKRVFGSTVGQQRQLKLGLDWEKTGTPGQLPAAMNQTAPFAKPASMQAHEIEDLEDLVKTTSVSIPLPPPSPPLLSSLAETMSVSMYENYGLWLKTQKIKWRNERAARKARHRTLRQLWKAPESLNDTFWQILQILPYTTLSGTTVPGEYRAWALIGSTLKCLRLTVPRLFYVNCKSPNMEPGFPFKRVYYHLPRSRRACYLYEFELSESTFATHAKSFTSGLMGQPSVEGVYEMQVPLLFRALARLGSVAALDPLVKVDSRRGTDFPFDLKEMNGRPDLKMKYLDRSLYASRLLFVYIHLVTMGKSSLLFAIVPGDRSTVYVWCLDSTNSLSEPFIKNQVASFGAEHPIPPTDTWTASLSAASHIVYDYYAMATGASKKMYQSVRESLSLVYDAASHARQPIITLFQASPSGNTASLWQHLVQKVPCLNDAPFLLLPSPTGANSLDMTQALNWHRSSVKETLRLYSLLPTWLDEQIAFAKSVHLPLCNLSQRSELDSSGPSHLIEYDSAKLALASDIAFYRIAKSQNHLLWYSPSGRPDLGSGLDGAATMGENATDAATLLSAHESLLSRQAKSRPKNALASQETDESSAADDASLTLFSFEKRAAAFMNAPGFYDTVCYEIEVSNVLVNAVLESHILENQEFAYAAESIAEVAPAGSGGAKGTANAEPALQSVESLFSARTDPAALPMSSSGNGSSLSVNLPSIESDDALRPSFHLIRCLIGAWSKQVAESSNRTADSLLAYFDRWTSDASVSAFYEPRLLARLLGLKERALVRLVREFNRLGLRVIYADPSGSRWMVATRKVSPSNASALLSWTLQELTRLPGTTWLNLTVKSTWRHLLWMDGYNHAGSLISQSDGETARALAEAEQETRLDNAAHVKHMIELSLSQVWDCLSTLPAPLHAPFEAIIIEFISLLANRSFASSSADAIACSSGQETHGSIPQQDDIPSEWHDLSNASSFYSRDSVLEETDTGQDTVSHFILNRDFIQRLFSWMSEMITYYRRQSANARKSGDTELAVPLRMIYLVTDIFWLVPATRSQVTTLRRQLLAMMAASEFSATTTSETSRTHLPLLLFNVPCSSCWQSNTIDLNRPVAGHEEAPSQNGATMATDSTFACSACGSKYEQTALQSHAIAKVTTLLSAYYMQDATCSRCHLVAERNLSSQCSCSGSFSFRARPCLDLRNEVSRMRHLAKQFEWDLCHDFLSTIV